jgi:hypothetical protein
LTRREWENVATESNAGFVNIEVICSDIEDHQHRVENRHSAIPNLNLPTWIDVENREYHQWDKDRIIIDTAGKSIKQCTDELLLELNLSNTNPCFCL